MNIKTKILLILLTTALSSHLIISTIYFLYSQNSVTKQALNHMESVANIQYQRLGAFIDSNRESLSLIQSRTQLRLSLLEYQNTGSAKAYDMIDKILSDALLHAKTVSGIFIIDMSGQTIFSTSARYSGENFSNHSVFQMGHQQATSSLFLSQNNKLQPVIVFSCPLILKGRKIGVVAMEVHMNNLNAYLTDYTGMGRSGEVLLATETSSSEMLLFSPLRFAKSPLLVPRFSESAIPMKSALNQEEKVFNDALDYRNVPVVAVSRYFDELNLGMVVKMDREEVLSTNSDLKSLFWVLMFVVIVVAVTLSIWLANKITRPVLKLTLAAQRMASGRERHTVCVNSNDELDNLARALNDMAEKLVGSKLRLQQKVKAKTRELQHANKMLERISQTDSLTDLSNRRYFEEKMTLEWSRCCRSGSSISLIMIDVDHFKWVNDNKGHLFGDDCLRAIAKVLKNTFQRSEDIVSRYGGEEFAVILPNTSQEQALMLGEVIRQRVEELAIDNGSTPPLSNVTASVGVASCVPYFQQKPSKLICDADKALYKAKAAGRNNVNGLDGDSISILPIEDLHEAVKEYCGLRLPLKDRADF
ncbi:diguanylate cyclase [Vibrio maritimus]|uniref:diguanylate cyclase n=1 Tax=Vibrio maritimus TaxID=990268 RepID=A0A090S0X4_9VIBR|nr:diguanylate cyclase [Vibrio maritimus]